MLATSSLLNASPLRLMTFNFQETYSKNIFYPTFSGLGNFKITDESIAELVHKKASLEKYVDEKSTIINEQLKQAIDNLNKKKQELDQSYEKQKEVVAHLETKIQQEGSSFFSKTNAQLTAQKAKLSAMAVGGKLYEIAIKPFKKAIDYAIGANISQARTLPTFYEFSKTSYKLDLIRRELTINLVKQYKPSIICFQEGFFDMQYILEKLKNYRIVYAAANTPSSILKRMPKEADINPILYDINRVSLNSNGLIWLSENQQPFVRSWGAHFSRTCSWAQFKDIKNQNLFFIFNIHLSHVSRLAQTESLLLLNSLIPKITNNQVTFLVGDFNANSNTFPFLQQPPLTLIDTKNIAQQKSGPSRTYITRNSIIDYILVSPANKVNILKYEVLDYSRAGLTPSDHRPVFIDFEFKK